MRGPRACCRRVFTAAFCRTAACADASSWSSPLCARASSSVRPLHCSNRPPAAALVALDRPRVVVRRTSMCTGIRQASQRKLAISAPTRHFCASSHCAPRDFNSDGIHAQRTEYERTGSLCKLSSGSVRTLAGGVKLHLDEAVLRQQLRQRRPVTGLYACNPSAPRIRRAPSPSFEIFRTPGLKPVSKRAHQRAFVVMDERAAQRIDASVLPTCLADAEQRAWHAVPHLAQILLRALPCVLPIIVLSERDSSCTDEPACPVAPHSCRQEADAAPRGPPTRREPPRCECCLQLWQAGAMAPGTHEGEGRAARYLRRLSSRRGRGSSACHLSWLEFSLDLL